MPFRDQPELSRKSVGEVDYLPPGRFPPGFPLRPDLDWPLPGRGLEREPEGGLCDPPKFVFGFQPVPDFLSGRGPEFENGF